MVNKDNESRGEASRRRSLQTNHKKAEQLGMSLGAANNRLAKLIMFSLLQGHGDNVCFRCGREIFTAETLSLDHKQKWLGRSTDLFWDMENMAFSHLSCNTKARQKKGNERQGRADRKSAQLSIPYGTAYGRLRKMVLFHLIQLYGHDTCYRCGEKIITVEAMSIDHKQDWLDVDPALYWEMKNIAFSHHSCNVAHARKLQKQPIKHGTSGAYMSKPGCRCAACKEANRVYRQRYRMGIRIRKNDDH